MLARAKRKLTAEEFYDLYGAVDAKYELVDGEAWAMSGGTVAHAMTAGNIFVALRTKLHGSGCQTFNSDMGLRLGAVDVRYPDVAIYCDPRDLGRDPATTRDFERPSVIFEVLSPSTELEDRRVKVIQYKAIDSVRTIVLVDPTRKVFELHHRATDREWQHFLSEPGDDLELGEPSLTLTAAEIFDRA